MKQIARQVEVDRSWKILALLATFGCLSGMQVTPQAAAAGTGDKATTAAVSGVYPCEKLPTDNLTTTDLEQFIPAHSPGRVRIAWETESQEETYGFNILRADSAQGPYRALNASIIPGQGTSNVRQSYCYEDIGLVRGQIYFYQVEEVTNTGDKKVVQGTAATKIVVKTVEQERLWLQKKAKSASAK